MKTVHIAESDLFNTAKNQYASLAEYFPDLYLAGGYLRDLVYNKTPKDLDFYFRLDSVQNISYVFDELFPKLFNLEYNPPKQLYTFSEFVQPYSFINAKTGTLVQMIGMHRSMSQIMSQFDFSFNQIMYDGLRTYASDLFTSTLETKRVTPVTKTAMRAPGMVERCLRFEKKFPELDWSEVTSLFPKAKPRKSVYVSAEMQASTQMFDHGFVTPAT